MLPIPGLDPGTVDPSEAAFASGMLAGAGLREISQTLGLSRKRGSANKSGAMPPSATMQEGSLGELDKIMLLSRLQAMTGGGAPPMGPPPIDPMAAMGPGGPMPPGAGPLPMPMGAGPMPPMAGPGPLPIGPPPMSPQPALSNPGGALPLQLLLQMLSGTSGMV